MNSLVHLNSTSLANGVLLLFRNIQLIPKIAVTIVGYETKVFRGESILLRLHTIFYDFTINLYSTCTRIFGTTLLPMTFMLFTPSYVCLPCI